MAESVHMGCLTVKQVSNSVYILNLQPIKNILVFVKLETHGETDVNARSEQVPTWRSWTERQRSQRADVADGLVVGTPAQGVSWGIWTDATGPSTRLVAS